MSDEKLDRILESVIRLEEQYKGHMRDHTELRADHEAVAQTVMAHDKTINDAQTTLRTLKWVTGASAASGPALWLAVTKWFNKG